MLLEAGHEVILLLDIPREEFVRFDAADKFNYPNPHNIRAYRVADHSSDCVYPNNSLDPEYLRSIRIAAALSKVTERETLDLIEFYDYCGPSFHFLATPARSACAIAIRLHNTIELIDRKVRNGLTVSRLLHYQMERTQLSMVDGIFFPGRDYLNSEVRAIYPWLAEAKCQYSPPVLAPVVKARPAGNDVIFYGRLSTFKGLDTFLAGASIALRDPGFSRWLGKFVVIGPEETVASALSLRDMKDVVPEPLRDRFRFVGRVSHSDLASYLDRSAFAVFANRIESFCYAAHELHCAGVPLIVSDTAAFRDHFVDGSTAVFFDSTAADLAEKIVSLAQDAALRSDLSRSGKRRVSSYWQNSYNEHISAIVRAEAFQEPIGITPIIFSNGDAEVEQHTLRSLGKYVETAIILRSTDRGILIGGRPFVASSVRGDSVNLLPVEQVVLGLRAGDEVVSDWLRDATAVMARDSQIGALSSWESGSQGVQTNSDHLLPEHTLTSRQGLRRLIRILPGLTFAELAAQIKIGGEVSLLLAARARGLAIMESPQVGILTERSIATPTFHTSEVLKVEYDRFDRGYLAIATSVTSEDALFKSIESSSITVTDLRLVGTRLDATLCAVRSRPDFQPGEVWVRRCFAQNVGVQTPWAECQISPEWEERGPQGQTPAMVTNWLGTLTFRASEQGAIELQAGPYCGAVEVTFSNHSHVLNLRRSKPCVLLCRLSDLAVLGGRINSVRSDIEVTATVERHVASLSTRPPELSKSLLVAGRDNWALTRSILRSFALMPPTLQVDDLPGRGEDAGRSVAYLLQLADVMSIERLIIGAESEASLSLIDCLVQTSRRPSLAILVGPIAHFYAGERDANATALLAAETFSIVRRRPKDITVVSADSGILEMFQRSGIAVEKLGLMPPIARISHDATAPLAVAVLKCSRVAPTSGHLVAAARLIADKFPEVLICLQASDEQAAKIAGTIGVRNFRLFDSVAELSVLAQNRRAIALAAYPDALPPEEIGLAVKAGFLPIVGSGGLWSDHGSFSQFSVTYWDNAYDIADAATRIATDWEKAHRNFLAGVDASRVAAELQARRLLRLQTVS